MPPADVLAEAGDDPARFDETMRILDWLVTTCPDTEAGISARAVRMHLSYDLGREEEALEDAGLLASAHPDTWQAGWAHLQLAKHTLYEAFAKIDSDDGERRAAAIGDFEAGVQLLQLAIEQLNDLTDQAWEPFASLGGLPKSHLEAFQATAMLWQAGGYKALWEWDSAAACYWRILDIAPGSHTANLARKHLDNLINAGLVAGNPSDAPPRLVSLRSGVEGEHTRVFWDDVEREATVRGPHLMLSVAAGASVARVNGAVVGLEGPAVLVGGRLMVPRTLFGALRQARVLPDATGERLAALTPGRPAGGITRSRLLSPG